MAYADALNRFIRAIRLTDRQTPGTPAANGSGIFLSSATSGAPTPGAADPTSALYVTEAGEWFTRSTFTGAAALYRGVCRFAGLLVISGANDSGTVTFTGLAASGLFNPATDPVLLSVSNRSAGSATVKAAGGSWAVSGSDYVLTVSLDAAPGAGETATVSIFIP